MEEMKMMDEEQFHRLMSGFAIESSIKDAKSEVHPVKKVFHKMQN